MWRSLPATDRISLMPAVPSRPKSLRWIPLTLMLAALAGALLVRSRLQQVPSADSVVQQERSLMGTQWRIQIAVGSASPGRQEEQAIEAALDEVARIETLMSEWHEESPLSALNRSAGGEGLIVPAELRAILERGLEYGRVSRGAFDITWRGMGKLWRFDDQFRLPSLSEIESALTRVGYQLVRIEGDRVQLPRAGMAIGLGGIAKGYAIDRAASVLRHQGFQDYLVDGGGDVLAGGTRGDRPWRVGVRQPRGGRRDLMGTVDLQPGQAMASSGDYERFHIHQGVRYHHIIDPRSGRPAQGCRSVSVVAPSAEEADAMATAIFVLGAQSGLELAADRKGVEALIVDAQGRMLKTDGFEVF